jgi:hypothetical protein
MKLGDAFPLETLRGAGYKLRSPGDGGGEPPRGPQKKRTK